MTNISFIALDPVDEAGWAAHKEYANGLGLPHVRPNPTPLAVVGGGPSAADNVEVLRNFDGEIWAINEAWQWCKEHGIEATLYIIDPNPKLADHCEGVEKAILGDTVHPRVFDALYWADIQIAPLRGDNIQATISAAATAPFIAGRIGHTHLTFFGCDGSFTGQTHLYKDIGSLNTVWVECGGKEYMTTSQYIMGTEFIAKVARLLPTWISTADDGFLSALIEHGDYTATHVCRHIHEELKGQVA